MRVVDESHGAPNRTAPAVKRCGHSAREEKTMVTINTWNELRAILCNLSALTDDELHELYKRLTHGAYGESAMERAMSGEYGKAHSDLVKRAYWAVDAEEAMRYNRANSEPLEEYRKAHLAGHTVEEVRAREELQAHWSYYSDYYKDVWGSRPALSSALR